MSWHRKFSRQALLLFLVLFLVGCGDDGTSTDTDGTDTPRTWEVAPDGSGDVATIQAAVDTAEAGDVILLEDGTYTGDGNRDVDFKGKDLTVKSRSGDPATCIIDCEGTPSVRRRGFFLHSGETSASVIEGLTVTNGNGTPGGGLRLDGASPTIRNCAFIQNEATDGGGISILSGSNPHVIGCEFRENSAANSGGGLNLNTATATFRNCIFIGNDGGVIGGGLRGHASSFTLIECTMYGNSAAAGSGVAVRNGSHVTLERCIISGGDGSAVNCSAFNQPSSATLTCCDLFGNQGGDWVDCITDQFDNDGNISEDPLFCDGPGGDVRLNAGSPCLAAGSCGRIGALGQGCDAMKR